MGLISIDFIGACDHLHSIKIIDTVLKKYYICREMVIK